MIVGDVINVVAGPNGPARAKKDLGVAAAPRQHLDERHNQNDDHAEGGDRDKGAIAFVQIHVRAKSQGNILPTSYRTVYSIGPKASMATWAAA